MEFMPWNVFAHFLGADFKNRCNTEDYGGGKKPIIAPKITKKEQNHKMMLERSENWYSMVFWAADFEYNFKLTNLSKFGPI
jgi:hypothetical protein